MGTKVYDNALDLITFTRASGGTALRKISYGPELVTNGGFDTDTAWAKAGSVSITGGEGVFTSAATSDGFRQNVLTLGKVYKIDFDVTEYTAGAIRPYAGVAGFGQSVTAVGSYSQIITCANDTNLAIIAIGTTTAKVDNISVKEVLFDQPDGTLTLFNHPTNIPRIEYDASGAVKGLLVEEARTNLLTYSEDFTNAAWGKGSDLTPLTAPDAVGPDGLTSAFTLADDAGGGTSPNVWVRRVAFTLTAAAHCLSVYAKASGLSVLQVVTQAFGGTPSANGNTYFDLQAGTVGDVGNDHTSASIEAVGNGWYRCSIIFTPNATDVVGNLYLAPAESATGGVTNGGAIDPVDADGTSSILIYGAQLEVGAFATSYMPTTTATATRAADIASIPVSAFGYNQQAGSVVWEANPLSSALSANSGFDLYEDFSNKISLRKTVGLCLVDGVTQASTNIGWDNNGDGAPFISAVGFRQNSMVTCADGTLSNEDTSVLLPDDISVFELNRVDRNATLMFSGHIKSMTYYPRRLSNAQLQELTS